MLASARQSICLRKLSVATHPRLLKTNSRHFQVRKCCDRSTLRMSGRIRTGEHPAASCSMLRTRLMQAGSRAPTLTLADMCAHDMQFIILLQARALSVTVSGAEFEVSSAAVDCSSVLQELFSTADGDEAVRPTLPLSSSAFGVWIQGVDEAPEMEWNAFPEVLQVHIHSCLAL